VRPDAGEILERLARIRRLLAELESECGRTAEIRETFERLKRRMEQASSPNYPPLPKKP
jgi:hypothetical protein